MCLYIKYPYIYIKAWMFFQLKEHLRESENFYQGHFLLVHFTSFYSFSLPALKGPDTSFRIPAISNYYPILRDPNKTKPVPNDQSP